MASDLALSVQAVDLSKLDQQIAERYFSLDHLINRYDSEGQGPLRKGEESFRWSFVEVEARALLEQVLDLRVAIWLLRSLIFQRGLAGLCEGLEVISKILRAPAAAILPHAEEGEHIREAQAISLGWLGGDAFLALLRLIKAHPQATLQLGGLLASSSAADALLPDQQEVIIRWLQTAQAELIKIRECILNDGGRWERDPVVASEFLANLLPLISGTAKPLSHDLRLPSENEGEIPLREEVGSISIKGRTDVKKMIDLLLGYYEKNEPGHPAPIILRRFQRTIDASFEEMLGELFADGPSLIERIKSPAR